MKRSEVGTASITNAGIVHQIILMVALTLVLGVTVPTRAYASDGFLGGLQDLVGVREVESNSYEQEYIEDYDGGLRADPPTPGTNTLTDLGEDATTVDYVNGTLDAFNKSGYRVNFQDRDLLFGLQMFLGHRSAVERSLYLIPAVCLVFVWWGVRKSIKVIMSSFRKGRMNV